MQLFPASERVPVRLGAIVAIIAGAMAVGVLLLLVLFGGSAGDPARPASSDLAGIAAPSIASPSIAAPRIANPQPAPPPAPIAAALATNRATVASAASNKPSTEVVASTRSASIEPQSAASRPAASSIAAIKPYQGSPLDERLLFFPVKYPDGDWEPRGLRGDDTWFASADGTKLHGWYLPSEKPQAVVLYLHGNGGNLTDAAVVYRFLEKHLKATTLAFDYRGYGRSEGRPTIDGVVADARAARAWLAQKAGVPETSVVLMGRSLGGAVAVQLTSDVKPRGLILENTFSSLRAMAEHHLPNLAGIVPTDKLDSTALLARYDGPLLQAHADADRTVPFALGEELFRAAKGKKEFVRASGAGHNDRLPDEYYGKVMEFVAGLK